jgi:hypothetical protein
MTSSKKRTSVISVSVFVIVLVIAFTSFYGFIHPPSEIHEGVVLEKIYLPSRFIAGPNVLYFHHPKTKDYAITSQTHSQWLALVKSDDGELLKVHCDSVHYVQKDVGEVIHFRKYTGEILGIEYMSYSKEEEDDTAQ